MTADDLTPEQVGDAVGRLHTWLETRAAAWSELARTTGASPTSVRRWQVRALDAELRDHLLPYMELEEALLDDGIAPTAALEHRAIRGVARRIHQLAVQGEPPAHLVQAAVTALHVLVSDHLRHEREVYLPELATS
jgi:hypothetical protein